MRPPGHPGAAAAYQVYNPSGSTRGEGPFAAPHGADAVGTVTPGVEGLQHPVHGPPGEDGVRGKEHEHLPRGAAHAQVQRRPVSRRRGG